MEQQERKRRQLLNREIKSFAEKVAEAASVSVRVPFDVRPPSLDVRIVSRLVIHLSLTFRSVNYRLTVCRSAQVPVSNQRRNVWSISLTLHSS
jgi:hypothetical protein